MLEKVIGTGVLTKILEAFLKEENRDRWINVREIGRLSGVTAGTVSRRISELVEIEMLLENRPSRYSRIFQLNKKNKFVPILIDFYERILAEDLPKSPFI